MQTKTIIRKKYLFSISPLAHFCSYTHLSESKRLKQLEHLKTIFKPDESRLRDLHLDLKVLVPNFFTKTMPIKEYEPVPTQSKDANVLENSFIRLEIPIKNHKEIQNSLVRLDTNFVRTGRILECMDSIAGIVGYKHCFATLSDDNPFVLVTACVDKINLIEPITIHENIIMEGFVNHVGRTSMEIGINLFQSSILKAHALFTMVSRSSDDHARSYPCPKLQYDHLEELEALKASIRQEEAVENVERRKKEMKESYQIKPPSVEDTKIIHDIFLNAKEISRSATDMH